MTGHGQGQYSRISTQELSVLCQDEESLFGEEYLGANGGLPSSASDDEMDAQQLPSAESGSTVRSHSMLIGSNTPSPFLRMPSKARDVTYAVLFFLNLILVSILTGTEIIELKENLTIWSTTVLVVSILGSCLGILAVFLLSEEKCREYLLSHCVLASIAFEACLGNILLLTSKQYVIIGILLLIIAWIDALSMKASRENTGFTLVILQMAGDICKPYGLSLTITCLAVLIIQTLTLFYWGVIFVGLITKDPTIISQLLVGALLSPISSMILSADHWAKGRGGYVPPYSLKGCVRSVTDRWTPFTHTTHRLAFCLTATYGRTLSKAAEDFVQSHPESMDLLTDDCTRYDLSCTAKSIAGLVALVTGLLIDPLAGSSLPLFLAVCFLLIYSGIYLALTVYTAAVDGIIVAFFMQPETMKKENQIVYLRFLRKAETALR